MENTNNTLSNANTLIKELEWFSQVLDTRLKLYYNHNTDRKSIFEITPPDLRQEQSYYASIVNHYQFTFAERIIFLLAIIPHIKPELLNPLYGENPEKNSYVEFGGIQGTAHKGFLPTGETALFIIAGHHIDKRLELIAAFGQNHFFYQHNMLKLSSQQPEEPLLSGMLQITEEYFSPIVKGIPFVPETNEKFPAKEVFTTLDWEDLVLPPNTMKGVEDIRTWIKFGHILMDNWELGKRIKPGYRALFYGPPGTGKTLTAGLLGKVCNMPVYRVDLALTVSKWLGETEKNLKNLFEQAQNKNWILFFDEADSLFNKRTKVSNSNDRSSNQQVGFLLQKMEDFPGIIILASNLRNNIDPAFSRRIQSTIHFPIPGVSERLKLWQDAFKDKYFDLEETIDLDAIAQKYELAGGSIINVLRYACIQAIGRNNKLVLHNDILDGIRIEFHKDGKTL